MIRITAALLALLLLHALPSQGQSLSLFDIDLSTFPTVRAKMYAFDGSGTQVNPTASELGLTENGIPRNILSVTCPPLQPPRPLSSVLVVDVSGSMAKGPGGTANIDLARSAARAWVNALPLGESECALTSFDHLNYLNHDFTTDRTRLLGAIDGLTPFGATDYNMGLLLPVAGGLEITKNGRHQKVIVFLTDGAPTTPPDVAGIVAEAGRQNCIIYAVTLNMFCPQSLKDISTQTGGNWFESVSTIAEAEEIYRQILREVRSGSPCEIVWETTTCPTGYRGVELTWNATSARTSYDVPAVAGVALDFSPLSVFIRSKPLAAPFDTVITVTARNSAFNVINVTSSNAAYDINPKSFSLPQGGSTNLTVTYTPPDSGYTWTEFRFETDVCDQFFYASGGYPGVPAKGLSLKVDHPNGGEVFVVNSDTVITWSGIPATDWVRLEYTTNNGSTWNVIEPKTRGGRYDWHVPRTPSTQCLVRATRLNDNGADANGQLHVLSGHSGDVISAEWSPDGTKVVTASADRTAKIWDAASGTVIQTLSGHGDWIYHAAWSPDGTKIATGSFDGTARIWNASTGALIHTLNGHAARVYNVRWSPDGTRLLSGSLDATAKVWNASTGALITTLTGHPNQIYDVQWSPNGTRIATSSVDGSIRIWNASTGATIHTFTDHNRAVVFVRWNQDGVRLASAGQDNAARIWNTSTGALIHTLTGHAAGVVDVGWSPDGSRLATAGLDNTARTWNASTGTLLRTLSGHTGPVVSISWSPDGSSIATASLDNTGRVWNANSGSSVQTLIGHSAGAQCIRWSPEGFRIATGGRSSDNTARIWYVHETPEQQDVSDALFSIVEPVATSIDVDMGKVRVGSSKDSVVTAYVLNANAYPMRVDSIKFSGANPTSFALVSGLPPFEIPPFASAPVEFRFSSTVARPRSAQVLIYTQSSTLFQNIRGEGIAPAIEVVNQVIDFGQVDLGSDKDSLRAVTVRNVGTAPLDITTTRHAGPNDVDFSTLAGAGPFTLLPGDTARLDLRFTPSSIGRTSGTLLFDYNGDGSPAVVQLFGEGTSSLPAPVVVQSVIDFGKVVLGGNKDTLQTVTIANNGTVPIDITNTSHGGPNSTDFTTLAGGGTFTLLPGDTAKLDLRFTPSAVGPTSGTLLFGYNGAGSPAVVQLLGEGISTQASPVIVNNAINFGKVRIGSRKDSLQAVTIANLSTEPITITNARHSGPNVTDFTTLAGGGAFVLQPGDTAKLDLRFTPSAVGSTSGSLLFEFDGVDSPLLVRLLGEGIDISSATIRVDKAEAMPGDTIEVPVLLEDALNLDLSGATAFTAQLRFNATLLEPIAPTPGGTIVGEDRVIDLQLPTTADGEGVLMKLNFRAGLGNDSLTTLLLENATAVGGTVAMTVEAGEFRLLGICAEGGARLLNPNGNVLLKLMNENPIRTGTAQIELETIEIGRTSLVLTDVLGKSTMELINGEIEPGRRIISLDLADLPGGLYFLILATPTEKRTIPLELGR